VRSRVIAIPSSLGFCELRPPHRLRRYRRPITSRMVRRSQPHIVQLNKHYSLPGVGQHLQAACGRPLHSVHSVSVPCAVSGGAPCNQAPRRSVGSAHPNRLRKNTGGQPSCIVLRCPSIVQRTHLFHLLDETFDAADGGHQGVRACLRGHTRRNVSGPCLTCAERAGLPPVPSFERRPKIGRQQYNTYSPQRLEANKALQAVLPPRNSWV
jgi:hypothetical protein